MRICMFSYKSNSNNNIFFTITDCFHVSLVDSPKKRQFRLTIWPFLWVVVELSLAIGCKMLSGLRTGFLNIVVVGVHSP